MRTAKNVFLLAVASLVILVGGEDCTASIKVVWNGDGYHSEGPHWSEAEQALYWVDISAQMIYRLDVATNNVTNRSISYGPVTPVIPVKGNPGKFLIGVRTEAYILDWNGPKSDAAMKLLSAVDLGHPKNRMNDGKADRKGRLWIGTMGPEANGSVDADQGSLYLITEDNFLNPEVKVRPVSVSNGLAWTADDKYMFYVDSPTRQIDVFDFDSETAEIKNRRPIFKLGDYNITGVPDGMTIDTDDNIWAAIFNGGMVVKIDSKAGKLLEQHYIPVQKVTSVAWGGPAFSTLYVTTSRVDLTDDELSEQPNAGAVFAIEGTQSKGYPHNEFQFKQAPLY